MTAGCLRSGPLVRARGTNGSIPSDLEWQEEEESPGQTRSWRPSGHDWCLTSSRRGLPLREAHRRRHPALPCSRPCLSETRSEGSRRGRFCCEKLLRPAPRAGSGESRAAHTALQPGRQKAVSDPSVAQTGGWGRRRSKTGAAEGCCQSRMPIRPQDLLPTHPSRCPAVLFYSDSTAR
jgi:hypothetical protein